MEKVIKTILFMLVLCPFSSAATIDLSGIDPLIEDYDSGSIDIAQFIVHVDSFLKSEYQKLEKDGHFKGFTEEDVSMMFPKEGHIMKQTKDFGVMLEAYKSDNMYTIIWGLPPAQKAIERAVNAAEKEYADKIIAEEQAKVDTSPELERIKELESKKEDLLQVISDKEDEDIVSSLQKDLHALESQLDEAKEQLGKKQDILDGSVHVDFSEINIDDVICRANYAEHVKIRKLFEQAMPKFPEWYFTNLRSGVDNYFSMASGHQYLMHVIDSNNKGIKGLAGCAEEKISLGNIMVSHETDREKFRVWEEDGDTFYEFYFMPSKEMMKDIIRTKITDPNAAASAPKLSGDDTRMEKIIKLAKKYGGSFDAVIKIVDSAGENILHKRVTVNPDVLIMSSTVTAEPVDADVTLELDYDRMYEYMEYISKDVQGASPKNADWNKNENSGNVGHFFGILSRGFGMWINGVKVKPITEVPKLLFNLKLITEAFSD